MTKDIMIVGAGGHAKVVLSTAVANNITVAGFLDDHATKEVFLNYPLLGPIQFLSSSVMQAILALGNNALRKRLSHTYAHTHWQTLVHPHAYVHPSVKIGEGTVIFAGAIIQPDVTIGKHCIINTGATIDHDCRIADYAHIAPGAHLAGNVQVGEGTFLGIGSLVIPNIQIGEWATIAAGGVVVSTILPHKTVIGVPAKERTQ